MKRILEQYRRSRHRVPWRVREWSRPHALSAGRYLAPLEELRVSNGPGTHSLIAVGDIAGASPVEEFYLRVGRRAWGPVLPILESADLCIGNLEAVLTKQQQSPVPCGAKLRVNPEFIASLAGVFDGVTTANNHVLDFGPEALLESLDHLRAGGIGACGSGASAAQAWQPCRFTVGDTRIGMLGCCDLYSGLAVSLQQATPAMCEPEVVRPAIQKLRGEVDLVIVQLHWGFEFSLWPLAAHRAAARSFVDAGADLVLCHHAHVPLGMETYGRGLIAYGLGNFLFQQDDYQVCGSPWTKRTYALRVDFDKGGVRRAEPIPVEIQSDYQILPLEGHARREFLGVLGHISRRIADTESLENLEHHFRVQESLFFLENFRPTHPEHLVESRYRAGLLNAPVWRDTIKYLQSGEGAALETGLWLDRIRLAAVHRNEEELPGYGRQAETGGLAVKLAAEMNLMPYQPATTPWWLL
jgi:poly-gamma-glutamate capsule biosynthesis protein CapA/YwtB (metallophosphatase superfamily)